MMEEGIIKDRTEAIFRELQTVISVFYILMVGIGMLFEYKRYVLFGINIFDYADVFDFLIAPFKSPRIFLFILLSLIIAYVVFKLDVLIQAKMPKLYRISSFGWDKKPWYPVFRYFTVAVVFITYVFLSSGILAKKYKSGFHKNAEEIQVVYSENSKIVGKMIGKTNETLFLLTNNKVKIIPINALVKEIDLDFNPYSVKEDL